MAAEYHNRLIDGQRLSWDVARLRDLAAGLVTVATPVSAIFEFDEVYWFDADHPLTCRAVLDRARRIEHADLDDPILLSPDGYLIDGMHRVAKAVRDGIELLPARRLAAYPRPDRSALILRALDDES